MRSVIFLLAFSSCIFLASMGAPILVGYAFGEQEPVIKLTVVAATGAFVSLLIMAATFGYDHRLTHTRLLLAMVLGWVTLSFLGALPFLVSGGVTFERALFESVSGLTTTGASTLAGRQTLPEGLIFWRLQLEWIGGFMTLSSLFLVLSPMAIGGLPKRAVAAEWQSGLSPERDASVEHLWRYLPFLVYYAVVSVIVYFAFVASGADSLESAHLTMTTIPTGGFSPYDGDLADRHGAATITVMGIVLALSATSLFWQRYDFSDPLRVALRNREAFWIFLVIGLLTVGFFFAFGSASGFAPGTMTLDTIRESFFAAASVVATSGHETRPGVIALLPPILVFSVGFVAAAVFSTASGLKMHRLGAMLVQSYRELSLLIYPSSIQPRRLARTGFSESSLIETWPVFVLLLAVLAVSVFALAGGNGNFEAAFLSAMALLLNAGPLYEAYMPAAAPVEAWPGFRDFSSAERLIGCVIMLLGRLEFVAVFAIFNLRYWLSR